MRSRAALVCVMLALVAASCSASGADDDARAYETADGQEIALAAIEGPAVLLFWDPG